MSNDSSSELMSRFLADSDAAVDAMMNAAVVVNRTWSTDDADVESSAAETDSDSESCAAHNWPVLFLFTIVIAAIGTT